MGSRSIIMRSLTSNGAINIAGSTSSNILTGAQIYGNYLHDAAVADAPGCPAHHDGIRVWGLSGGSTSGINFYNNRIGGNFSDSAPPEPYSLRVRITQRSNVPITSSTWLTHAHARIIIIENV